MYEYRLKKRRRKHMQKINRYNLSKLQFNRSVDNINLGLGRSYSRAQTKLGRLREAALRKNQSALTQRIQKSQYAKALAQGKTGRSIKRMNVLESGALGRYYAQQSKALTYAKQDFKTGTKRDRVKARTALDNAYAKVVFNPTADVAPPAPVYQDVGAAKMQDLFTNISTGISLATPFLPGGGIAKGFGWWEKPTSERIIKKNIEKIGTAKSGLGIYKFQYIDIPNKTYIGTMVDEVQKIFPDAVHETEKGLGVDYSATDVEFREVVA